MIAFYLGAGAHHFISPVFYESMMPHWLPDHSLMNTLSGAAEIALGLLLFFPFAQRFSAWMIALMLAIFFAVIHLPAAFRFTSWDDWMWWIAVIRLPVQYFLIRWTLRFTSGKLVYFWSQNPAT